MFISVSKRSDETLLKIENKRINVIVCVNMDFGNQVVMNCEKTVFNKGNIDSNCQILLILVIIVPAINVWVY